MEKIILSTDEDITLFTDEEQVAVIKINNEFRQESKLKGELREFTIFNDCHCYQRVHKKHLGKYKFRINLNHLNARPEREYILSINWLITAAMSAILSLSLIYIGWFSSVQISQSSATFITAFSVSFSCIALLIGLLRTTDRIILFSRYGHVPILEFINKNPDKRLFSIFLKILCKHIRTTQENSLLGPTERLTLELKELRRLKDEGVIIKTQYEQGKKLIFRNKAFKKG